jgi:acyl-CoA reductase-like NAD-dependent aldehyde dehydrogenase
VATLYRVVDLDAAIQLANGTEFGLGANAWTNNEEGQGRLVRHLAAGMVFINGNVTSYPQLPFGGIKTPVTAGSHPSTASASSATSRWLPDSPCGNH